MLKSFARAQIWAGSILDELRKIGKTHCEDLAGFEECAAGLIEELLPSQMDEAELSALVDQVVAETGATSVRDMGKVMAAVVAQGGVRVDGKVASRLVKERLSA